MFAPDSQMQMSEGRAKFAEKIDVGALWNQEPAEGKVLALISSIVQVPQQWCLFVRIEFVDVGFVLIDQILTQVVVVQASCVVQSTWSGIIHSVRINSEKNVSSS